MIESFGKVILLGEHAVVYGRTALAAALPGGLRAVKILPRAAGCRVVIPAWSMDLDEKAECEVGAALRRLKSLFPADAPGFEVHFKAAIPAGAGLGASAALSAALVRVAAETAGAALDDSRVREYAHELEKVFHGEPSGLDDTVAVYGGQLLFRRDGWEGVTGPVDTSGYEAPTPQSLRPPLYAPPLVIAHSGVPRSTRRMVEGLRLRREHDKIATERSFDRIESLVWDGISAMDHGDYDALGEAMYRNHEELAALGLSLPRLDEMVDRARAAGAYGAKLTGAGGGGCVIAFAPGDEKEIASAWRDMGCEIVYRPPPRPPRRRLEDL